MQPSGVAFINQIQTSQEYYNYNIYNSIAQLVMHHVYVLHYLPAISTLNSSVWVSIEVVGGIYNFLVFWRKEYETAFSGKNDQ